MESFSKEESRTEDEKTQQDTGLLCLVLLARLHEVAADPDQLAHQYKADGKPFTKADILLASKQLGLTVKAVNTSMNRLDRTPLPAMAVDADGGFFILARADGDQILIYNPLTGRPEALPKTDFGNRWTGELILFTSRHSLAAEMKKFDFTWFIPAVRPGDRSAASLSHPRPAREIRSKRYLRTILRNVPFGGRLEHGRFLNIWEGMA